MKRFRARDSNWCPQVVAVGLHKVTPQIHLKPFYFEDKPYVSSSSVRSLTIKTSKATKFVLQTKRKHVVGRIEASLFVESRASSSLVAKISKPLVVL